MTEVIQWLTEMGYDEIGVKDGKQVNIDGNRITVYIWHDDPEREIWVPYFGVVLGTASLTKERLEKILEI